MRPKSSIATVILLLCSTMPLCARSQDLQRHGSTPSASISSYPETTDGLKKLVQDMIDALTSENDDKLAVYVSRLTIPDHAAWFSKAFGADEGARLEAKYADVLPRIASKLRQRFNYALDGQMSDVSVSVLQKPASTGERLDRAILEAMVQPAVIYRANGIGPVNAGVGAGPMARFPTYLGDFVFVDGAFRYIDLEVFEALSTAPKPRIRQGEKVTAAYILRQESPHYPEEARKRHIEGNVILHAIIGTDGAVKNLELVNGDPLLAEAAIESVKKWKYKPTLLNGQPMEIDTTVTVTFALNR